MSLSHYSPSLIPEVLTQVERALIQTWTETGCGHLALSSQRLSHQQALLTLQGATHYHYVLQEAEIRQALGQGATGYPYSIDGAIARQVDHLLLQIWQQTGYGCVDFNSERRRHDQIAVTVQGTISHRYTLSDEQVHGWRADGLR